MDTHMHVCIYITHTNMSLYLYVKRFMIRPWLASPKVCRVSFQAGGPGEFMVKVQSEVWPTNQVKANVPVQKQSGKRNSLLFGRE